MHGTWQLHGRPSNSIDLQVANIPAGLHRHYHLPLHRILSSKEVVFAGGRFAPHAEHFVFSQMLSWGWGSSMSGNKNEVPGIG